MANADTKLIPGRGKIASLDGVRAVSFLIVFVAHAGLDRIVPGRLGVNIFFLLSGYLITTLMIREREQTGWISLKLFYMRRTLRIFPPMYAIMAAIIVYLWAANQLVGITWAGVCSQAFYYTNYWFGGGRIPGLGVLWSLAVEEHFYLFFPPLFLLLTTRLRLDYRRLAITLLGICGLFLIWRIVVVSTFSNGLTWARDTTDCRADSILFGCVLACFERTPAAKRVFTRQNLERIGIPCSAIVLLLTLVIRNPVFRETLRYTLQGLAIAPILYYVVHVPESWMGRFLNLRWLATLGTLSYSLYLMHPTVLEQTNMVFHSKVVAGVLSLLISIVFASIVHVLIEKPTDAWRRRLRHTGARDRQGPSVAQVETALSPTLLAE